MKNYLYPMKLIPVTKEIIWGGERLKTEFGKTGGGNIAESWELCVHKNGVNTISNGNLAGMTLETLFMRSGGKIISEGYDISENGGKFPVLIKYIDAKEDLSVQVHPGNEYALKNENELGKTEMWYIVDAVPEARIVYGFNGDYTREELEGKIAAGKFTECLNFIPVTRGEIYFIPAGLVHAICGGILLAEIQQNSDTTYRFYDYDRVGSDGKKRELHIEKALDVCVKEESAQTAKYTSVNIKTPNCKSVRLSHCEYFKSDKYEIDGEYCSVVDEKSFHSLLFLDGEASIICGSERYPAKKGDSYFLPSGTGEYTVDGICEFILTGI